MIRILGLDPGTATTGYSLLKGNKKKDDAEVVKWGLIETNKDDQPAKRLQIIFNELDFLIRKYKPDIISMEKVFFASNAKTAIRVGQAQGVMLYCAALNNLEVFEYSPMTVKKIITGSGRGDKKMIQVALRERFGKHIRSENKKKSHFDDAADAIALAYCYYLGHYVENNLVTST